jgi:putative ABC transport system substrate-binding protein
MLRKITFLFFLFSLSFVSESLAKTYNIAIIKTRDAASYNETALAYRRYVKKSIKFLDRERIKIKVSEYSVNKAEKKTKLLVQKIKSRPYDIVVTLGRQAFESVKDEIKETPIIFANMFNPYNGDGEPSEDYGNVTGIKMDIPVNVQFEALKSFVPYLERIGVLYSENEENIKKIKAAEKSADELGLTLISYKVTSEQEVAETLDRLIQETDALWMIPDYTIFYSKDIFNYVVQTTIKNEFPLMGISKAYVKAGALFAVSWDFKDIGRQAAKMSYDVIKGHMDKESRIRPLKKFPMVINKRTAESIDLRIPQWVSENTIEFYE